MGAGLDIGADELTAATPTASTPATTTPTHPAAVRPPAVWAVSVLRGARVRFVVDRATLVRIRVAALTGRRPAVSVLVHAKPGVNVVALPGTRARRAGRYRVSVKPANGTAGSALFRVAARAPSSARRRSRAAAR
jgi:hypothetical protein